MWRKPAEANASEKASETTVPASVSNRASAEASSSSNPAPAAQVTPAFSASSIPSPAPAAVPAPAPSRPISSPSISAPSRSATGGVTHIGSGLKIRGEISGTSDLTLDGEAQGKISLPDSKVTVGPNGRVHSDIEAREIVIQGEVHGNLKAGESVSLGASSRVQGSVLTPRISIEDGAGLRGNVEMTRAGESKPKAVAASAAAGPTSPSQAVPAELKEK
jgi:cytoskeletal protein CcmA (bactofilin family)